MFENELKGRFYVIQGDGNAVLKFSGVCEKEFVPGDRNGVFKNNCMLLCMMLLCMFERDNDRIRRVLDRECVNSR